MLSYTSWPPFPLLNNVCALFSTHLSLAHFILLCSSINSLGFLPLSYLDAFSLLFHLESILSSLATNVFKTTWKPRPFLKLFFKAVVLSSSAQSLSCVRLFVTSWIAASQASVSITNTRTSHRLTSIESVMPSSHLILCHPFLLLPPIPPNIRVFSNETTFLMRWPKYWSFRISIISSKEHSDLISFRMDWLDPIAVQRTLKNLLQYHNSKASIFWCSAFFTVHLLHPYITTGKIIALTRWIFVGKVMSLLFNVLYRLGIIFLPRSKHLLISWLQSPSAVILEPQNKLRHCVHCFPIYLPWSDGTRCHDLSFLNVEF